MTEKTRAGFTLAMTTAAFGVCFAAWVLYSILIAFVAHRGEFDWTPAQIGSLVAVPVLTGSLSRLPLGLLADRFGGRPVLTLLMLASAAPMFLVGRAGSYEAFWWAGLGFGLTGGAFAVGVAYASVWFPKSRQGTALGVFGAGNAGAALTTLGAPVLLRHLASWRTLPEIYAAILAATAVLFFAFTRSRRKEAAARQTLRERLAPLAVVRVWRFGLYYVVFFGAFVALTNWLPLYYLNVYGLNLVTVGVLTSCFALPSGLIRAAGGWMADRWGARRVMYAVFAACLSGFSLLIVPGREVVTRHPGLNASCESSAHPAISADFSPPGDRLSIDDGEARSESPRRPVTTLGGRGAEALVSVGDRSRSSTRVSVGIGVRVFTVVIAFMAIAMGIGMAAVFRLIPDHFPNQVGVVGGVVGVLGGLGGYACSKVFGALLQWTGLWTSCWAFLALLTLVSLVWMRLAVQRLAAGGPATLIRSLEDSPVAFSPVAARAEGALWK